MKTMILKTIYKPQITNNTDMKYFVIFFTLINCQEISCPDKIPGCMVGHSICDEKQIDTFYFKSLKKCYQFADTTQRREYYRIDSLKKMGK